MGDGGLVIPETEISLQKQPLSAQPVGNTSGWWNQDRINRLTEMWEQGFSASRVGAELGTTRNAVIGKANRIGLDPHLTKVRNAVGRPRKAQKPRAWKPRVMKFIPPSTLSPKPPLTLMAPLSPPVCEPVDFMGLDSHHCRYIVSPDGQETKFCGSQRLEQVPYCAYHAKRCYNYRDR